MEAGPVEVTVYDLRGREVKVPVEKKSLGSLKALFLGR